MTFGFPTFNYTKWLAEHSIPGLSKEDQKLIDQEFPLQAMWEKWTREDYYYTHTSDE